MTSRHIKNSYLFALLGVGFMLVTCSPFADSFRIGIPKIVGGFPATIGAWPSQALIYTKFPHDELPRGCGGTLIHQYWILTTATCLTRGTSDSLLFGLGFVNVTEAHMIRFFFRPAKTILHPCHVATDGFRGTNLALIRLPFPFPQYLTACLPKAPTKQWRHLANRGILKSCIATGYGRTDARRRAEVLHEAFYPIVSKFYCDMSYPFDIATSDKICGFGDAKGRDTCDGDQGGGLFCKSTEKPYGKCGHSFLTGLILGGDPECGSGTLPPVFIAVAPHVDWIHYVMDNYDSGYNQTYDGRCI